MATFRQTYVSSPSATHLPPPETRVDLAFGSHHDDDESTNDPSDTKYRPSLSLDEAPRSFVPGTYLSPMPAGVKPSSSTSTFNLTDDGNGTVPFSPNSPRPNDWPQPRGPIEERPSLWSAIFPKSLACRLYLITVLVETVLDLVMEGAVLSQVNAAVDAEEAKSDGQVDSSKRKLPVYLAIFALAHVFQALLAMDAVYNRNTLQFVFLAIFNFFFGVYAIIQISEVKAILAADSSVGGIVPINVLTIIIPVIIGLAEIAYIALGWRIYGEFGWSVYKLIGANRKMKGMYGQYQVFQSLVRFSTFFWLGFSVQLIALVLEKTDFEFYVTIAALPLSMLLLFEGHLAARHESKWMMGVFVTGCIAALVYFIYKLFRIWSQRGGEVYKTVYKSLTIFACICIIMLVITFIWAMFVLRNFGQGLKSHMSKKKDVEPPYPSDELEMGGSGGASPGLGHGRGRSYPMSSHPSRMSIE